MPHRIHLYLVDDHALFREGLMRLLASDSKLRIVGSTGDLEDALVDLAKLRVDVLILDYDLGVDTALGFVRSLRERELKGKILLVTAGLPNQDALELIRLGICGIFHKQNAPEDLHRSILGVAQGQLFLDQKYLQTLVGTAMAPEEPAIQLSDRDKQILRMLLEGASNKEISMVLKISESAVKASLQALFGKTGVRTRSQLVRIVLEKLRDVL